MYFYENDVNFCLFMCACTQNGSAEKGINHKGMKRKKQCEKQQQYYSISTKVHITISARNTK